MYNELRLTYLLPNRFCRKIRNMDKGRHRVKGRKWPLVMYNMKLHVPGKPLSGFLKSDTVLHVCTISCVNVVLAC